MIKTIAVSFLAMLACATVQASGYEKYPVSPLAYQITFKRIGDVLFRYVEFFDEYPCLRLETFESPSHNRIDRKEVCKFRIENRIIDLTKEPLTGVIYENFKLEKSTFSFSTDIIFARPGSYYANCTVVISDKGKMTDPACTQGERPLDPDDKKQ